MSLRALFSGNPQQVKYYQDIVKYYLREGKSLAVYWAGKGAQALGLTGPPTEEAVGNLLNGFSADGSQKLVQNAGRLKKHPNDRGRQIGWDTTLSDPKTVSVVYSQCPVWPREAIDEARREALRPVLAKIEEDIWYSRTGKGGTQVEKAGAVVLVVQEIYSRALDPQLHFHCVWNNVTVRERDGSTGALAQSKPLYDGKLKYGALYQKHLAAQLEKLGLPIERKGDLFEIKGVPLSLCKAFSKRRQQIKKVLEERGLSSAKAASVAALDTRPAKRNVPLEKLFEEWQRIGREHGWSTEQALALLAPRQTHEKERTQVAEVIDLRNGRRKPRPQQKVEPPQTRTPSGESFQQLNASRDRGENEHAGGWTKEQPKAEKGAPKEPYQGKFDIVPSLRLKHRQYAVFRKAPEWNRLKKATIPYLTLGKFRPREDTLVNERNIPLVRFQVRRTKLAPRAPDWSPLRNTSIWRLRISIQLPSREAGLRRREARYRAEFYQVGDEVFFRSRDVRIGVDWRDRGVVTKVLREAVHVELENGRHVFVPFRLYTEIKNHSLDERTRDPKYRAQEKRRAEQKQKASAKQTQRTTNDHEQSKTEREREEERRRQQQHSTEHSTSRSPGR